MGVCGRLGPARPCAARPARLPPGSRPRAGPWRASLTRPLTRLLAPSLRAASRAASRGRAGALVVCGPGPVSGGPRPRVVALSPRARPRARPRLRASLLAGSRATSRVEAVLRSPRWVAGRVSSRLWFGSGRLGPGCDAAVPALRALRARGILRYQPTSGLRRDTAGRSCTRPKYHPVLVTMPTESKRGSPLVGPGSSPGGGSGKGGLNQTLPKRAFAKHWAQAPPDADDRARDFSRRSGHLSGGADALAAVAETVAVPGGRRLGHPSRRVAGRPGQERPETPAGRGTDARRGTDAWRRGY